MSVENGECDRCNAPLVLLDGHEWPEEETLCWGCLYEINQQLRALLERARNAIEILEGQQAMPDDSCRAVLSDIAVELGRR